MNCKNCGAIIGEKAKACPNCGTVVEQVGGNLHRCTAPIDVAGDFKLYNKALIMAAAYFALTIILNIVSNVILRSSGYDSTAYEAVAMISSMVSVIMFGGMFVAAVDCGRSIKFLYAIPYVLLCLWSLIRYLHIYNLIGAIFDIGCIFAVMGVSVLLIILVDFEKITKNIYVQNVICGAIIGAVVIIYNIITNIIFNLIVVGEFYLPFSGIVKKIILTVVFAALGAFLNTVILEKTSKK